MNTSTSTSTSTSGSTSTNVRGARGALTRRLALGAAALILGGQAGLATAAPVAAAPAAPAAVAPTITSSGPVTGADISWPNCPKGMGIPSRRSEGQPMPSASSAFVVIGVTNGPGFYPNPCLASQVAWAKKNHKYTAAYAMTTYPSNAQLAKYRTAGPYKAKGWRSGLRNTGWAQAQFNIANMRKVGLKSPIVWMDVEFYPVAPWSKSQAGNRAVFEGARAAYLKAGYRVGIYSTGYQWRSILGTARYGMPEWHTAGKTSLKSAQKVCSSASIQGGRAVLGQWWTDTRDHDVLCSRFANSVGLRTYFTKY